VADQPIRPTGVPGVSLASLAGELGIDAPPSSDDVQLTGVSISATATLPGDLFVALPGRVHHGASFAADALELGAVAVLTDPAGADILGPADVAVGIHPAPREILGRLSQRVYNPGVALPKVLSVTGTNGKTSVVFYLEAILRQLGETTALSNSTERRVAGEIFKTPLTTPEANELQALLAIGAQRGVTFLALEASAQAIERHRLDGIIAEVSGFTNLSHDHFEDYGNMERYLEHKLPLFQPAMSKRAVVSLESSWGDAVVDRAGVPVVTISPDAESNANWSYRIEQSSAFGETFEVSGPHGTLRTKISAIGEHMVRNAALAIAMVAEAGIAWERFSAIDLDHGGIDLVVPGRIERVSGDSPVAVFVDAGRSADAYSHTFESLRARISGKLIVLAGTSGNRDRSKRPIMGALAARAADLLIVTDDDPRKEDPSQIRADLLEGAKGVPGAVVEEIPQPSEAIRFAVNHAHEGDAVVWMGPGSQHYRDIGGVRVPFSARDEARSALTEAGWLSS
jgi:UDP-N-acetylmuramoyl-L-alanyl-D-glutamate--2,6-diaminopimelate ligase